MFLKITIKLKLQKKKKKKKKKKPRYPKISSRISNKNPFIYFLFN